MTKLYISDTHFGHQLMISDRIRRPRPFSRTDEMDEFLIEQRNRVVNPSDVVFHLGDSAFQLTEVLTGGDGFSLG